MQRVKVSPVLAYIMCGILIGPFGIAQLAKYYPWISLISINETSTVNMLGELGIISLLFMIGLELSFERLKELKVYIFGLGSAQIIITGIIIFIIARLFGNPTQASIIIGASFALSSTAIVMKLLEDRKLSNRPIGTLCFSILLMQDLAVVPILILTSFYTGGSGSNIILELIGSLLLGALTVFGIYWVGKKVFSPLIKSISFSTTSEWLASFIVFFILICSVITQVTGLSLALGAFIAGLLVGETEFKHEVEVIINPIKGTLLGIFFLSIGMMIDLREILAHPFLLMTAVIGLYIVKAIVILLLCLIFKVPGKQAGEASIYLAQPGEFAVMIMGLAMSKQLLPEQDVQFFLLVTVVAMVLTPFVFDLSKFTGNLAGKFNKDITNIFPSSSKVEHKVVIAGFGSVGMLVGKVMIRENIPYIAFDNDVDKVQKLKKENYNVIYGDARKKELWNSLLGENIEAAVIAIDDHDAAVKILKSLRTKYPLLFVVIRSKDNYDLTSLYEEGACEVVVENVEISLMLTKHIMKKLGREPEEANKIIEKYTNLNDMFDY